MRDGYVGLLTRLLRRRSVVPIVSAIVLALGATMFVFVGRDFFPAIDGGQIQLHVRVPAGTRIEKTEQMFQRIEDKIREIIPEVPEWLEGLIARLHAKKPEDRFASCS